MTLFQSMVGSDPQMYVNNTAGKYAYYKRNGVAVLVDRNVMFICSDILDKDTSVSMELPSHPAFFLQCVGTGGSYAIKIEKDANLVASVRANYQIQAQVAL